MRMLPFMVMPAYKCFFYERDEGLIKKKNISYNIVHYFLKQMRRLYDQESNVII